MWRNLLFIPNGGHLSCSDLAISPHHFLSRAAKPVHFDFTPTFNPTKETDSQNPTSGVRPRTKPPKIKKNQIWSCPFKRRETNWSPLTKLTNSQSGLFEKIKKKPFLEIWTNHDESARRCLCSRYTHVHREGGGGMKTPGMKTNSPTNCQKKKKNKEEKRKRRKNLLLLNLLGSLAGCSHPWAAVRVDAH